MQNAPNLWLSGFPIPKRDGHKYDRGHALIYGGEVMTGAARLAARAAQRIGTGLVTIATPAKSLPIYAEALESVIVREANDAAAWRELLADQKRNAVLIGPGLGLGAAQAELVLAALETKKPCVLDADALTNFTGEPDILFSKLHDQCVLTPHEGEFEKLFGKYFMANGAMQFPSRLREGLGAGGEFAISADVNSPPSIPAQASAFRRAASGREALRPALEEKITRTLHAAKLAGCAVLLKGADTIIAAPDGQNILNNNAPPWLATAGAGDVLAGLILGLVAQKMPGLYAAAAAAWVHGKIAADFGAGLIAEDLVAGVPHAIQALKTAPP